MWLLVINIGKGYDRKEEVLACFKYKNQAKLASIILYNTIQEIFNGDCDFDAISNEPIRAKLYFYKDLLAEYFSFDFVEVPYFESPIL